MRASYSQSTEGACLHTAWTETSSRHQEAPESWQGWTAGDAHNAQTEYLGISFLQLSKHSFSLSMRFLFASSLPYPFIFSQAFWGMNVFTSRHLFALYNAAKDLYLSVTH